MGKKIDIEIDYGSAYIMLGIVSSLADYQLAHYINQSLDIHYAKYDDFVFNSTGEKKHPYSWYKCFVEELKVKAYLIGNRFRSKRLLPEYKQIDYFIIIENSYNLDQLNEVVNKLRKIKKVTAVFKLDLKKIKNIDILLEENEMHEMGIEDL